MSVCCLLFIGLVLSSAIVLSLISVYLTLNTIAVQQGKILNFSVIYSSLNSVIIYLQISDLSPIVSLSFNLPADDVTIILPVQSLPPGALKYIQDNV